MTALSPAAAALCASRARLRPEPPALFTPSGERQRAFSLNLYREAPPRLEAPAPGGSQLPSPHRLPNFPSVSGAGLPPRSLQARQPGPRRRRRAARAATFALGGGHGGVPSLSPPAVESRRGCGRGACPPLPRDWEIHREPPPHPAHSLGGAGGRAAGWQPRKVRVRAPRKCRSAGLGGGRWAQMVLIAPRPPRSSRVRAWRAQAAGAGGLRAPGAGRGRRPPGVSRAFSRCPLEGCGPRPHRALSMVRHGAARPARRVSSPDPAVPSTGSWDARAPRSFPLSWVSPFVLCLLLVFLSSSPSPTRGSPPPQLSPDSGISELLDETCLASAVLGSRWDFS